MMNWENIEAKVRNLIKSIVEPTVMRALENKSEIDVNRRLLESSSESIENLEKSFEFLASKLQTVDTFARKLADFASTQKIFEMKVERDKDAMRVKMDGFYDDVLIIKDDVESLKKQREAIRSDISQISHAVVLCQGQVDDKLNNFTSKVNESLKRYDTVIEEVSQDMASNNFMMKNFREQIANTEVNSQKSLKIAETNKKNASALSKKVKELARNTQKDAEHLRNYVERSMNTLIERSEAFKTSIKELPISNLIDCFDLMYKTSTESNAKRRITEIEIQKYNEWIEQDISVKLLDRIINAKEKAFERSKEIEIRKKKTVINLRKKTQIADAYEQNQSSENNTNEKDEEESVESEEKPTKKRTVQLLLTEETPDSAVSLQAISETHPGYSLFTVKQELSSLSDEFQAFKEEHKTKEIALHSELVNIQNLIHLKLSEQFSKISVEIDNLRNVNQEHLILIEKSNKSFEDLNKKLNSTDKNSVDRMEEMYIQLQNVGVELKSANKSRKRANSDMKTDISKLSTRIESNLKSIENASVRIDSLKKLSDTFTEYFRIQNALESQDEIDRETISLMGYTEQKKVNLSKKEPVTLDNKCVTCSNQKSMIISAFKMACLVYLPSLVEYSGNEYTRKELLQTQKSIIEKIDNPVNKLDLVKVLEEKRMARPRATARNRNHFSLSANNKDLDVPKLDELPKLSKRVFTSESVRYN